MLGTVRHARTDGRLVADLERDSVPLAAGLVGRAPKENVLADRHGHRIGGRRREHTLATHRGNELVGSDDVGLPTEPALDLPGDPVRGPLEERADDGREDHEADRGPGPDGALTGGHRVASAAAADTAR